MKKLVMSALVVMLGLGLAGCCCMRCMTGHHAGSKSAGCMTVCSKCGQPQGECKCGAPMTQLPVVGTAALKTMMDAGVPMIPVDSRTGKYDDGRRIPGAVSLSPVATEQEIQNVLKSKDALIISYCANLKCHASLMMGVRLQALGYTHVLEYPYGIDGWAEAGYPVALPTK
jgi:rhodanese-related sulfurtransferase